MTLGLQRGFARRESGTLVCGKRKSVGHQRPSEQGAVLRNKLLAYAVLPLVLVDSKHLGSCCMNIISSFARVLRVLGCILQLVVTLWILLRLAEPISASI